MKPETKKRLGRALAWGSFIPTVYFLLLMMLEEVSSRTLVWLGEGVTLPISWAAYLYEYLFPAPASDSEFAFYLPGPEFWAFVLIANAILYSLLIYLGLWWKQRIRLK